jgi:hypothetical protein
VQAGGPRARVVGGYLGCRGLGNVSVEISPTSDLERSPTSGKTKQIASEIGPPPDMGGRPAVLR